MSEMALILGVRGVVSFWCQRWDNILVSELGHRREKSFDVQIV